MRITFIAMISIISSLAITHAYAEPLITRNVPILQNIKPADCPSSWNGKGDTEVNVTTSGYGQSNALATAAVQSCVNCAYDNPSQSCICATCYSYAN